MRTEEMVILTGAGVSAESGLGTFRDKGGLWTRFDLEEVATPEGYARDPARVLDFYNMRRRNCREAAPNPAHAALARLQRAWPGRVTLVTQNIDDLHERAGSAEVIHMHGRIMAALCAACAARRDWAGDMTLADACPACGAAGTVRPDVVWFGEMPYELETIWERLAGCDLFVAIGTSGSVYPAAGFVADAMHRGARTLEINLEPSDNAGLFHERLLGPASETVPAWVARLLEG
ncbi:MAG TPA: NAD-dependent deacylase [Thermohalobaculum sp.]|nr:NAD-dependent deacylase [Thermohalobaculum sp.]